MKIAFVIDQMKYGGIERVAINYLKILVDLGYEIDIFILDSNVESIVEDIPDKCNIYYINYSKYYSKYFYWPLIERNKYGLYLLPALSLLLFLFNKIYKITKIKKTRYDLAIAFSGHINDLTFVAELINAKTKLSWLHGSLSSYMLISKAYGILYNKIKKIVVLSTDGQEEVLIYNKWLNLDIYKLYNPISFTEKKVDIEKIKYLKEKYGSFFLVVSRMSPQKDPYTIIDSMEILSKKYDINNNVLFLGNGPEMSKVKEYARKTSISHLINFLGNVSDVENYYSSAQLFIHSSPLEGLPTVLLESLYFEVPIVATDSKPGVREILGNNEYGRICPVGDSKAMAREISSLLSDEKIYNKYKSLSKDRADDFSEIKITKELLYIIKNSSL